MWMCYNGSAMFLPSARKKLAFLLLFGLTLFSLHSPFVFADENNDANDAEDDSDAIEEQIDDYEEKIKGYEKKLEEVRGEKQTLQSEITYMDNQIYLTNLKINETQARINEKEEELGGLRTDIEDLQERILTLSELLEEQREVLQKRARESYKTSRFNSFELIFGASSLTRVIERIKYLRVLKKKDQDLIDQMESTREGCSDQKDLLEEKKVEVEEVKAEIEGYQRTLEGQRASLADQRRKKEVLLAETRNDEQKYQELLREARAQLAATRALVSSRGGADLLSDQTDCDDWGCYYNQRDKEWGTYKLGESNLTVAGYGCLVSSVAMIGTYHGYSVKPKDIAVETSPFLGDTAYLLFGSSKYPLKINGFSFHRVAYGSGYLDSQLEKGPVIAGLYSGPAHFIVIKEKKDGEYIMKDPWYEGANDIPLSEYYSVSDITRIDRVIID